MNVFLQNRKVSENEEVFLPYLQHNNLVIMFDPEDGAFMK